MTNLACAAKRYLLSILLLLGELPLPMRREQISYPPGMTSSPNSQSCGSSKA